MKKIVFSLIALIFVCGTVSAQTFIKANAAAWAIGAGNIGFESAISKKLTIGAEVYGSVWDFSNVKSKGWFVTPELRYYFGDYTFTGHHLGIYGVYGQADKLQWTKWWDIVGLKNNVKTYSIGLAYGYTWWFNHYWTMDLFIGAGFTHAKWEDNIGREASKNYFLPSRGGLSFGFRF